MTSQESAPSFGTQLGDLYKRWTLDCVVGLAHAVSLDFSDRPSWYQKLSTDTARSLTKLQGEYGFDPNFPDMPIRQRLMKPIFGGSDWQGRGRDDSEFQQFRLPVLAAAADFSENAQPTTFPSLRERVRNAIAPLKTHMADLQGASLSQTDDRISDIFDASADILKDSSVAAVFGIVVAIDPAWPLESTDDQGTAQGAKLIEAITTQLKDNPCGGVISREAFVHVQRIAEKGFQSIRIILDQKIEDPSFDIDPLITELYAWGSELRLVGGNRPLQLSAAMPSSAASATTQAVVARTGTSKAMPYKR